MRVLIGMVLVAFGALTYAGTPDALEDRKIQYLIAVVENLHDAQFIRNDVAYEAKSGGGPSAVEAPGRGVQSRATVEDFIRLCASVSSMSGRPYQIRFSDGRVVTSEEFLRQRLAEFVP